MVKSSPDAPARRRSRVAPIDPPLTHSLSLPLSPRTPCARCATLRRGSFAFRGKERVYFFPKKNAIHGTPVYRPCTPSTRPIIQETNKLASRRPREKHRAELRVRRAAAMSRFGTGLARRLAFGVSSSRSASCAGQPLCGSSPAAQALGGALSVGLGDGEGDKSALFFIAPTLLQTRGFAVPKRKVSRSKKGMKENHPSKRIRSKKTYSYCEKYDEVLGPHQICSGILKGTCTCSSVLKPAHGTAEN